MKNFFGVLFVATLCSLGAHAQDQRNSKPSEVKSLSDSSPRLSNGTSFQVELTESLDSKKAKVGDQVKAKLTHDIAQGPVSVAKGSKVIGHVSSVQPYTKGGNGASLGIVFDKFILKNGSELPFQAIIVYHRLPSDLLDRSAPGGIASTDDPQARAAGPVKDPSTGQVYERAPKRINGDSSSTRIAERGGSSGIYLSGPTFNSSAGDVKLRGGTTLWLKVRYSVSD